MLPPTMFLPTKQQTIRIALRRAGLSTKPDKAGKKRRRPKSRLERLDKRGLTVREHQIMLAETNFRVRKTYMDKGKDLMNVAKGRLGWMRHQLYSYWNPDYDKSVLDSDKTNPNRKFGAGPVMDTRWWIWNIVFALSPAIYIALYCEFRGKPRQFEFHRQQQLVQMRAAMGDEWCETNAEKILKEYAPPDASLWDKVVQAMSELSSLAHLLVKGEEDNQANATPSPPPSPKESKEITAVGKLPNSPVPDVSPETKSEDENPTVEALVRRVRQLEQQQQRIKSPSTDDESQSKYDVSFEDFETKSGIRKRMDASLVKQWEDKLAKANELEEEQRNASSMYAEQLDLILNRMGLQGLLLNGANLSPEPQETLKTVPEPAPPSPSKTEETEVKPPITDNPTKSSQAPENIDDTVEVVVKRKWWNLLWRKPDEE